MAVAGFWIVVAGVGLIGLVLLFALIVLLAQPAGGKEHNGLSDR